MYAISPPLLEPNVGNLASSLSSVCINPAASYAASAPSANARTKVLARLGWNAAATTASDDTSGWSRVGALSEGEWASRTVGGLADADKTRSVVADRAKTVGGEG